MMNTKFYILLVKLPDGRVIKTHKMNVNTSTIESLKLQVAYMSNIPYNNFELHWNNEPLYPDNMLLKDIIVYGEKLPVNKSNVNNLIFAILDG